LGLSGLDEDHVRAYAAAHWNELPPVAEDAGDDDEAEEAQPHA
jgi:hypothetical protein